jgi:hypothetical protein
VNIIYWTTLALLSHYWMNFLLLLITLKENLIDFIE